MMSRDPQQIMTRNLCHAWVRENVFTLRQADYRDKYPRWPGMVGLEIEMGVVDEEALDSTKPSFLPLRGPRSISTVLENLASRRSSWELIYDETFPGRPLLTVSLGGGDNLSFEPGGQLEFSSRPFPCLLDATHRVREVQGILAEGLKDAGARLLHFGINPWLTPEEIGLQMTKPRYQAMNKFFSSLSPAGPRMMRQTCTVQVNLDFGGDEKTLAKRYVTANLLAPYATALFAYSPMSNGQLNGFRSRRGLVWQELDATRTGFPRGLLHMGDTLSRDACAAAYTESLLAARVVFVTAMGYQAMDGHVTFGDWIDHGIDGLRPTLSDFETHMTLHFPEVRARGFLELRSVDCQSPVWQDVPAIFYTTLLYIDANLDWAYEMLLPRLPHLLEDLREAPHGLTSPALRQRATALMERVLSNIGQLSPCFRGESANGLMQKFYTHFTARGRTPADDLISLFHERQGRVTPRDVLAMEDQWRGL